MTHAETAAYITAQSICALAEIEGMKADNTQRALIGESPAYTLTHFQGVINEYGIHHNAVMHMIGESHDDH